MSRKQGRPGVTAGDAFLAKMAFPLGFIEHVAAERRSIFTVLALALHVGQTGRLGAGARQITP
jgi:hypothetical protein